MLATANTYGLSKIFNDSCKSNILSRIVNEYTIDIRSQFVS
jgi:hypothetical protein